MNKLKHLLLIVFVVLFQGNLFAGVNLKNGNFYISYTDITFGDDALEITRTYNSKSVEKGIFGFGWGSQYETKLAINGDGTITLFSHGGGSKRTYIPTQYESSDIDEMTQKIMQAAESQGRFVDKDSEEKLFNEIRLNREKRNAEWRRYVQNGLLKPHIIPVGTTLRRDTDSDHEIQVTEFGYILTEGNQTDRFDKLGLLIRSTQTNGNFINIRRDGKGFIREISNHLDQKVVMQTDTKGRIIKAIASDGKVATYKYDGDDLIDTEDAGGNRYAHRYDNNHNMTKIIYDDDSELVLTYEEGTQYISTIKDRNGDLTSYNYFSNDVSTLENRVHKYGEIVDQYGTEVTKKGFNNRDVTNSYTYTISRDETGRRWTSNIATVINGIGTETEYHPCGAPLKIVRGNRQTEFDYNAACNLVYRSNGREIVELSYDPKHQKISKVDNYDSDRQLQKSTEFSYDEKGNLTLAKDSNGRVAKLIYNDDGKIERMVDEDEKTLLFEYNDIGKPTKIIMPGTGVVNVAYDAYGEIEKVDSPEGHKMALQITQMFQNLLALVKPAGVSLNL